MSGLTTFLQTELLTLSSEARRKHPDIKEAAERLSVILRSFKERPGHSVSNELAKSEDALRPFVLACETRQIKLVTIAIGCIQKLISYHAIPETSVRSVLRTLTDISVHGVDIQLKILQTVLPLLTNYKSVHDDVLAEALLICFRLQDSKIVVVNNTAAATLRQLVIYVFDKVTDEDTQPPTAEPAHSIRLSDDSTMALHPCAKDAYYLFQDLCLLTNNEAPEYLRLTRLSNTFGLELIESVLTNHYALFREHKELCSLLRERVCPMIIKTFSEKHDFPQTVRLTRVVYILIKQFSQLLVTECEVFLSMFVKILEPDNPLWQRVLAMEIFRGVCGNPALLRNIFAWYDASDARATHVFHDMITAFGRLATEKPTLLGATQGGRDSIDFSSGGAYPTSGNLITTASTSVSADGTHHTCLSSAGSTIRIQCIDQLDKADPPAIPDTYIFYLALLCLNSIADGLAGFTLPRFSAVTSSSSSSSAASSPAMPQKTKEIKETDEKGDDDKDLLLVTAMANAAWPGLLAAMSFFITADLDQDLFQSTLRSYQNFTNVCGILGLVVPRDAFLTNLCKNAIPSMPAVSSKGAAAATATSYADLTAQQQLLIAAITLNEKNLYCLRILLNITMFLGSVLDASWYLVLETLQQADFLLFHRPTPKGAAPPTPTANAAAAAAPPAHRRALTSSSSSGALPPPSSLSQVVDADHVAIISTSLNRLFENCAQLDDGAFLAFITALCQLSADFSGAPFGHGKHEQSSRAKLFNEKSFVVDKLRTVTLLSMKRLLDKADGDDFECWDLIMSHFIATVNFVGTPGAIRSQVCDTLADIIVAAMDYILAHQLDQRATQRLLKALDQCISGQSGVAFEPVQKMALETLHNILQTSGHSFTHGWHLIFDMLCSVTRQHNDITSPHLGDNDENDENDDNDASVPFSPSADSATTATVTLTSPSPSATSMKNATGLIKVAFASLQLICTDFLALLSPDCLRLCIVTLGAFSSQREDLNISLTAVGLLWNLSDFIQTKRMTLATTEDEADENDDDEQDIKDQMKLDRVLEDETDGESEKDKKKVLHVLWMLLLLQLSHVCVDARPEVRNGAIQTLFRTILMNGSVLGGRQWQACLWQILFPLLDAIKTASRRAAELEKETNAFQKNPLVMHHSRDTADKQWDETKVLVLHGIANIFRDFLATLHSLPQFDDTWQSLLAYLEDQCLHANQEVALAAVKSLHTMVTPKDDNVKIEITRRVQLWRIAWHAWLRIGQAIIDPDQQPHGKQQQQQQQQLQQQQPMTQETLSALVLVFQQLYDDDMRAEFSLADVQSLLNVLRNLLVYPHSPQYRLDIDHLSPLQDAVLNVIHQLDLHVNGMPPLVLMDLCEYMTLAFHPSVASPIANHNGPSLTFIALNKRCSTLIADLFKQHANQLALYTDGVFERVLMSYGVAMKLKYDCPVAYKHGDDHTPLWKLASKAFLDVVCVGLDAMHQFGQEVPDDRFLGVWRTLVDIFEGNLLSTSTPPSNLSIEELDVDEGFDISMLSMIQNDLVLYMGQARVSMEIIHKLVHVIRQSSRLYFVDDQDSHHHRDAPAAAATTTAAAVAAAAIKPAHPPSTTASPRRSEDLIGTTGTIVPVMKESFAYAAFGMLFQLCSAEKKDHPEVRKRIAQGTVPVLLERCETILRNYTMDEPLLGRCPFPRVRKEEMLFFLRQAIQLQLQQGIVDQPKQGDLKSMLLSSSRAHLFYLYPSFIRMLTCDDPAVVELIRECLRVAGLEMGFEMGPSEV
ncbi:hypothetical protein BC940DRAFT_295365 [Gongronella butleri]|nr:hypothetical protein BC940DRAFT_295365 [Gongronella butleri]